MPKQEASENLIRSSVHWSCRIHGVIGTPQFCAFCRQAYGGHRMRFEAIFRSRPSDEEIRGVQIARGYHPAGYSGPWRLSITEHAEGWEAVWYCSDNCD